MATEGPETEPGDTGPNMAAADEITAASRLERALDDEHRKARLVAAFFDDAARAAADDGAVWQALAERATEAVGDSAVATLVSDDGAWLEAVGVYHPDPARMEQIRTAVARRPLDGSVYGDVIRKGSVLFVPTFRPDAMGESARQMSEQQRQVMARSDVHSIIALPLLLNGSVKGVLAVSRTVTPEPYTTSDVEVLRALAARATIVLDNAVTHRDLRAALDRLRTASDRFETIIEGSPIATVVLDAGNRVRLWNAASEGLLGWTAEEVIGRSVPMRIDPGTDGPGSRDRLTGSEIIRGTEIRLGRKGGDEVPVALYAAPLREGAEVTGSVLRFVDLAERNRLEAQLLQAQRLESVGRLAGGIAHDFNNVLTAILGFSRIVQEDLPAGDLHRANVRAIEEAAERATGLVRQLLAFSRQQVLRPQVLDLGHVIHSLTPMLRRLIGEDVVIRIPETTGLWSIEADRGQLEQVLVNLVVNARDAMPTGGNLTIEMANVDLDTDYAATHAEVTPGPHVLLAVSDTGSGMDAETARRIFEPFFTTKEVGRGTGLGLATVYGIVRQSGGHIWVYSEPSRGTTFRLYFPRTIEAVSAQPVEPPRPASFRGDETILVVEDEEILRDLIEIVLTRLGYSVVVAPDGRSAIELARQQPLDLAITDVVMPGQSGFEVATALRAIRPSLKILFMSGYTAGALESHGRLAADELLLEKPFTPASLAQAVRDALGSVGRR
jgi:PAS domain S-box-containing protein